MRFDNIDVSNGNNLDLQEVERIVTVEEQEMNMIEAYTKTSIASSVPTVNRDVP